MNGGTGRQDPGRERNQRAMDDHDKPKPRETALADSTIPIRLADIRRRCSDLIDGHDEIQLSLAPDEEEAPSADGCNPYDSGAWKIS